MKRKKLTALMLTAALCALPAAGAAAESTDAAEEIEAEAEEEQVQEEEESSAESAEAEAVSEEISDTSESADTEETEAVEASEEIVIADEGEVSEETEAEEEEAEAAVDEEQETAETTDSEENADTAAGESADEDFEGENSAELLEWDEDEEEAVESAVEISVGISQTADIELWNSAYFVFTVDESGYYSITLTGGYTENGNSYYPRFVLYDSEGNRIASEYADYYEGELDIYCVEELEAATYYLEIASGAVGGGDYEESVAYSLIVENVSEDDYARYEGEPVYSDAVNGTVIEAGTTYKTKEMEDAFDDYSYFIFTPSVSGEYTFFIPSYTEDGVIYYATCYLYNDEWDLDTIDDFYHYMSGWSYEPDINVEWELEAGTTYYIVIGYYYDYENEDGEYEYGPAQFDLTVTLVSETEEDSTADDDTASDVNDNSEDTDADVEDDTDADAEDDTDADTEDDTDAEADDENVSYFVYTDGSVYAITDNGDGTITVTDEEGNESIYTVVENENGTYTLTDEDGNLSFIFIDEDGTVYAGYIFTDNDGNEYTITDNGDGTITVTDEDGNESIYAVTENEDGTYTLTDEDGNVYTVYMDEDGTVYLVDYTAAETEAAEEAGTVAEAEEVGTIAEAEEVGTITEETTSVQTGDANSMGLWIVLGVAAGAAVIGVFGRKKLAD